MTPFVYDLMYFMHITRNYDYRDLMNRFEVRNENSLTGFMQSSEDLFRKDNKYGYELIVTPALNYRTGCILLLYKGECVLYTTTLTYKSKVSKICNEFLEVNYTADELHMYDLEMEKNDKFKSIPVDIDNHTEDYHFNHLIWMDLPDFELTKQGISIYKDVHPFCKYFNLNYVATPKFFDLDLRVLEFPSYVIDSMEDLRGNYKSSRTKEYQIITDPSMKSVYDTIVGGTK